VEREPVLEEVEVALDSVPSSSTVFLSAETHVGEGLRAVFTRIRLGDKGQRLRTLAVVSGVEGDGKTSVAMGLAAAAAHAGQRVLLIDADLRRRDVGPKLGLEPVPGLAEWLESGLVQLQVRRLTPVGFYLLSAGVARCRPELLATPRLPALLAVAERIFDLVILDSAPLLPVADSLPLRERVNGFVMVVRARHTPREAVARAVKLLGRRRILGLVMNGYQHKLPSRRGYDFGYGTSYRYGTGYLPEA
jgi:Mrp family chromosome partitioning ATPase